MVTNKHKLILLGSTLDGVRVSAETLAEALSALLEGARLATRFVGEVESLREGPRPAWLDAAPSPRAVRLTATVDTISATGSDVVLTLEDGEKVAARLEDHDAELLKIFFGKRVVVSGHAHFKPSGRLLLIDVEYLALAEESDLLFARIPEGHVKKPLQFQVPQENGNGVAAFFGIWPGEETDAELLAPLAAHRAVR